MPTSQPIGCRVGTTLVRKHMQQNGPQRDAGSQRHRDDDERDSYFRASRRYQIELANPGNARRSVRPIVL